MSKLILPRRDLLRPSRRSLIMAAPALLLSRPALSQMMAPIIGDTHHGGGGGSNPFSLVVHGSASTSNTGTTNPSVVLNTFAVNPNLIIFGCSWYGSTLPTTPQDSQGNTWLARTRYGNTGANAQVQIFYCYNPSLSTSHTFTGLNNTGSYGAIFVAGFTGSAAAPYDVENGAASSSPLTSLATGPATPNVDNELIISLISENGTTTPPTINSSFTLIDAIAAVSSVHIGGGLAYLKQTTAALVNPTWSFPSNSLNAAAIASFK